MLRMIMKILINAITIKEGGGAVVFTRTVNEMIKQDTAHDWVIVVDEKLVDQIHCRDRVSVLTFPWTKKSPIHFLYWNEFFLPRLVKKQRIDCVYSQVNTLPFRKLLCREWVSILHAGYFSPDFISLQSRFESRLKQKLGWFLRKKWVFSSIKKAELITVPTQALGNEIIAQLGIPKNKVAAILPGVGLAEGNAEDKIYQSNRVWRIGYVTKYGVQKNFDVLFRAAKILKNQSIPFKIILTLNENHPPFQYVKKMILENDIADVIENCGESSEAALRQLYFTLDLFVFPSLCESIGFTLMEAMYYRLPILASNIASNRELLGEKGYYFDPHDAQMLAKQIHFLMQHSNEYEAASQYSANRATVFSWERSAKQTLQLFEGIK